MNAVYRYATDGRPTLHYELKENDGTFAALAVVLYSPNNIRLNRFCFLKTGQEAERNEGDDTYFGRGSRLRFLGSTSGPLQKIREGVYADMHNTTYRI